MVTQVSLVSINNRECLPDPPPLLDFLIKLNKTGKESHTKSEDEFSSLNCPFLVIY